MQRVVSRLVAAAVLIATLVEIVLVAQASASAARQGSASNLDVVGGPVAVGSTAVVVSVDVKHLLHLDGVDPVTDDLVWQHPYSASAITAGVPLTPAASGSTVIDLVPAMSSSNPVVLVAGVNASTGALEWRAQGESVVSDNPTTCVSGADFCVPAYNSDGSLSLAVLSGATGAVDTMLSGPSREIGPGLYQSDAQTPTFEQISSAGSPTWTKPVSSIFGPGYDPNYGWNVLPVGGLNVGSVAPVISGSSMDLSANKTAGFSIATGAVQWTLPGMYQCMGPLAALNTQLACQFNGTIHRPTSPKQSPSLRGVTLKLVGFDPNTGSVTWSFAVKNLSPFVTGNGVQFIDGTQLLVRNAAGKTLDLDTSTGKTTAIKSGQVVWCQKIPTYRVVANKNTPGNGLRSGQPVFFPCTANGHPTSAAPPSSPTNIGTTINGIFIWPSPTGLQTHEAGRSSSTI